MKKFVLIPILSLLLTNFITIFSSQLDSNEDEQKSIIFETQNEILKQESDNKSVYEGDNLSNVRIKIFLENNDAINNAISNRPSTDSFLMENTTNSISSYRQTVMTEVAEYASIFLNENYSFLNNFSGDADIYINPLSNVISFEVSKSELSNLDITQFQNEINKIDEIDEVYISETSGEEVNPDEFYHPTLDDALININAYDVVQTKEFTGNNINIGIIESNAIPNFNLYPQHFSNRNISFSNLIDETSNDTKHADAVSIIATSNESLASGSNIYAGCVNYISDIITQVNWMVENNVNVINTSLGANINGTYDSTSKEIDRIIHNSLLTIVGSAGNNGHYITSPKASYNYITVGAADDYDAMVKAPYSSYVEGSDFQGSKPNLIAPGAIMTEPYEESYINSVNNPHGTSFAAPQVTGCIALLMEEFPYLVAYPELVTSIITSSASPMSSTYNNEYEDNHYDGSGLHNQIGAGLLNYEKMREAANQYLSITRPKNSSAGIIPQYIDIVATDEQRIRASSAWLYDEDTFTDYDLELYKLDVDGTMDKVAYIDDPYNNVEFIDFDVQTTGTYRLVVNQKEQNTANDFIGLSYVLIDDEGGSTSGATNIDDTLDSHFEIDRSIYEDYGDTYNNEAITETEINDGIHIYETTRKRARYTDDGKLVLSAKSNDSNSAYMEYKFDITDPINDDWGLYNIKYQFGLWSDDESLIRNSSIDLYGLHHGSWLLIRHFDPKEMSTDPNNLKTYIDCLDFPVNGLRFYVKTNYTNNDNNVGRVVIGNIEGDIHYHLYTKYEQYNDNYHKVVCGCGDYHLESHTWGPSYSSGIYEYANCTKCNEQHNMTSGGPIVTPIV